jgi:hypothetical protein
MTQQYSKTQIVTLVPPSEHDEEVVLVSNDEVYGLQHIDQEGFEFYGKNMNDDQKYQLIRQMAASIKEEYEESPHETARVAELTEELVQVITQSEIEDKSLLTQLYRITTGIVRMQTDGTHGSSRVGHAPLGVEVLQ